ncbi:MAG TPA: hypothetical protein VK983_01650 [Candidatus Limnocylindrales bacterium]|nr:hypothetical protein [Candidatus Limnocylindrales bacterium]
MRRLLPWLLVVILVVASAGAYGWQRRTRAADQEAIWPAITQMLSLSAVTCTVKDQAADRSSEQQVSLDLDGPKLATSRTTISHAGSRVTTEGINTEQTEFVRYTEIKTRQKNASGQAIDASPVLNIWGKQAAAEQTLYGQTVLGGCIIPVAHLEKADAATMAADFQKRQVFKTDSRKSKLVTVDGRQLRQYDGTVQPEQYLAFMKGLAQKLKLRDLDSVQEQQYKQQKPEQVSLLVDPQERVVRVIRYGMVKRTMTFSDFNKAPQVDIPQSTIPTDELERRLQALGT